MRSRVRQMLGFMGDGYRLRVPHDLTNHPPSLRDGVGDRSRMSMIVTKDEVQALIGSGMITKLTEHGEGQRLGWRSAGYDGEVADWWVCTQ